MIIDNQANNIEGLNQSVEAFGELTKIQQRMIGTIRKISELQGVVSKSGHKIGEIETIGFPPSITVHLLRLNRLSEGVVKLSSRSVDCSPSM